VTGYLIKDAHAETRGEAFVIYVRTCTRRVALIFAACPGDHAIAVDPIARRGQRSSI